MMNAALSHRFASVDGGLHGGIAPESIGLPYSDKAVSAASPSLRRTATVGMHLSEGHNPTASYVDTDSLDTGVHSCPHCEKHFDRACDLNKHAKSHSRPFKCAFQSCKYWSLGWPTAKELERHNNDKHSAAPRTYPCLFQHCSYKSKRESNCKQHMEKTHGWSYVRSKSNGRRVTRRVGPQLASLKTFMPRCPSQSVRRGSGSLEQPPRQTQEDFVLFPHEHDDTPSGDEHDDSGYMDADDRCSQGSDVVIPWTSPDTRLRRRETFLQTFHQKFNGPEDDLPIDPRLASLGGVDSLSQSRTAEDNLNLTPHTARTEQTPGDASIKHEHAVSATSQSFPSARFALALQQRPAGSAPPSNHSRKSSATVTQSAVTSSISDPAYQVSKTSKRKEDAERGDEHPQKKFKPSPRSDFRDNQMPDIYVAAYPEVYNREIRPLYQSCETEHKDISTLVRHLSRPPHRLYVSERCIHSFDVEPVELSHAKRGVCRRCWVVFTSRDAFDNHLLAECDKVSRGKREKWQILYDSFTPLATDNHPPTQGQAAASASRTLPLPNASADNQSAYAGGSDDEDDSHAPPRSPTTVEMGPRVPLELEADGEVDRLRRENRELRAVLRVVLNQANGIIDLSRRVAPNLLEVIDGGDNDLVSGSGPRQPGRLTFPPNGFVEQDAPDAATLVGQMNSHSTDVDRQGMMEDIQQTFSRTSSGMSGSDKSTIRHVSNSPPQRYEAYHGGTSSTPRPPRTVSRTGPTPTRHQPTSLPDSGYGSDKKLNSIAGRDPTKQTKHPYSEPNPPETSVAQDQTAGQTPNSPTGRQDQVEGPGPQPGHSDDLRSDPLPSSGMSPDLFTAHDDADAYYLSKDLMEQFADPGYSQPSSSSFQS